MQQLLRRLPRLHTDDSGQVVAFFVCGILVLFGFFALVLNTGVWYLDRRVAQNQADAAALAGVQELPATAANTADARDAALDWLERNGAAPESSCALDPANGYTHLEPPGVVFKDKNGDGAFDTIRVCIRRGGLLFFNGFFDLAGVDIGADAAAGLQESAVPYALMAMNPTACRTMFFAGNAVVNLEGSGNSYTRSTCANAFQLNGNHVEVSTAGSHDVVGGAAGCASGPITNCVTPNPSVNFPDILPDPWADVPLPPVDSSVDCSLPAHDRPFTNDGVLGPGTYCRLSISGSGTEVRLTGGVYVFKEGVSLDGGADTRLTSEGADVLIYITCPIHPCRGAIPQAFEIRGNDCVEPKLEITGHSSYEHIAIWVDRTAGGVGSCDPQADPKVFIQGQGDVFIDGNIYVISTTVDMGGQGDAEFDINGSIVGDKICFRGQAEYNVEWDALTAPRLIDISLVE